MSSLAPPLIAPADERHLDALMAVMQISFDPQYGEAWSALQLSGSLALVGSYARRIITASGDVAGFTLCRVAGPEVELLLIAVSPQQQGLGLGRMLVTTAADDARQRGATELFLEVRENNLAARALYRTTGFVDIGRRADYYKGANGMRFAAITMRRLLS